MHDLVGGFAVGSIGRLGQPRVFRLLLPRAQAPLADDERTVDPGVLLGLDAVLGLPPFFRIGLKSRLRVVAVGSCNGARWARDGTRLIGILAGAIPGIARGCERGIRGEARLRRHSASGKRQRQQEDGGRFDHDAALCTRELREVAPIMFKIP
ncbi:hypothetical protein MTR72_16825 [Bradyrhizobium sp. ISRA442]|uniref:hypothetical protein n=1 Tax=Bradyrhizobium sp. ISRA442 TaxID=2866197 RepID=UPI00311ACF35